MSIMNSLKYKILNTTIALVLPCGIFVLVTRPNSNHAAQSATELQERFLREGPAAWKAYQDFAKNLQGNIHSKTIAKVQVKDRFAKDGINIEFKQNRQCKLYITRNKDKGDNVYAYNTKYLFSLIKKSLQSQWIVTDVIVYKDDNYKNSPQYSNIESFVNDFILQPFKLDQTLLTDIITLPVFKIIDARSIKYEEQDLIEISFDCRHSINKQDAIFIPEQSGKIIVDPSKYWCIIDAKILSHYLGDKDEIVDSNIARKNTYKDSNKGLPIIQKAIYDNGLIVITNEYELAEHERLPPDSEFTLSAFGLPEPLAVTATGRTRWYLWISIAGLLCVIAGVALYALRHRLTTRQT